jgi:hypothetical protein
MLPLNFGPQPNIGKLCQLINDIGQYVVSGLQSIQQQQQQQAVILNQLQSLTDAVNDIQAKYGYISSTNCTCRPHLSVNRIEMRLSNATASADAPLSYPAGIVPGPPLPLTKQELSNISGRLRLEMLEMRYSSACCSCRLQCLTCSH